MKRIKLIQYLFLLLTGALLLTQCVIKKTNNDKPILEEIGFHSTGDSMVVLYLKNSRELHISLDGDGLVESISMLAKCPVQNVEFDSNIPINMRNVIYPKSKILVDSALVNSDFELLFNSQKLKKYTEYPCGVRTLIRTVNGSPDDLEFIVGPLEPVLEIDIDSMRRR